MGRWGRWAAGPLGLVQQLPYRGEVELRNGFAYGYAARIQRDRAVVSAEGPQSGGVQDAELPQRLNGRGRRRPSEATAVLDLDCHSRCAGPARHLHRNSNVTFKSRSRGRRLLDE